MVEIVFENIGATEVFAFAELSEVKEISPDIFDTLSKTKFFSDPSPVSEPRMVMEETKVAAEAVLGLNIGDSDTQEARYALFFVRAASAARRSKAAFGNYTSHYDTPEAENLAGESGQCLTDATRALNNFSVFRKHFREQRPPTWKELEPEWEKKAVESLQKSRSLGEAHPKT